MLLPQSSHPNDVKTHGKYCFSTSPFFNLDSKKFRDSVNSTQGRGIYMETKCSTPTWQQSGPLHTPGRGIFRGTNPKCICPELPASHQFWMPDLVGPAPRAQWTVSSPSLGAWSRVGTVLDAEPRSERWQIITGTAQSEWEYSVHPVYSFCSCEQYLYNLRNCLTFMTSRTASYVTVHSTLCSTHYTLHTTL